MEQSRLVAVVKTDDSETVAKAELEQTQSADEIRTEIADAGLITDSTSGDASSDTDTTSSSSNNTQ